MINCEKCFSPRLNEFLNCHVYQMILVRGLTAGSGPNISVAAE